MIIKKILNHLIIYCNSPRWGGGKMIRTIEKNEQNTQILQKIVIPTFSDETMPFWTLWPPLYIYPGVRRVIKENQKPKKKKKKKKRKEKETYITTRTCAVQTHKKTEHTLVKRKKKEKKRKRRTTPETKICHTQLTLTKFAYTNPGIKKKYNHIKAVSII